MPWVISKEIIFYLLLVDPVCFSDSSLHFSSCNAVQSSVGCPEGSVVVSEECADLSGQPGLLVREDLYALVNSDLISTELNIGQNNLSVYTQVLMLK